MVGNRSKKYSLMLLGSNPRLKEI